MNGVSSLQQRRCFVTLQKNNRKLHLNIADNNYPELLVALQIWNTTAELGEEECRIANLSFGSLFGRVGIVAGLVIMGGRLIRRIQLQKENFKTTLRACKVEVYGTQREIVISVCKFLFRILLAPNTLLIYMSKAKVFKFYLLFLFY